MGEHEISVRLAGTPVLSPPITPEERPPMMTTPRVDRCPSPVDEGVDLLVTNRTNRPL
jgi:hypothetical protein